MSGTTQQTSADLTARAISNALRKQGATGSAYSSSGVGPGASQQHQAYPDQGPAYADDSGSDPGGSGDN